MIENYRTNAISLANSLEEYLKKIRANCFQEGYVVSNTNDVVVQDTVFRIEYYKEPHEDEYCVSKVVNDEVEGMVQLYKHGVIQLSWKVEKGRKKGELTMFDHGKVSCMMDWKFFTGGSPRAIENTRSGIQLVISDPITGKAVYRGSFGEDRQSREGYGFAYYPESGHIRHYAFYKNDKVYRYIQEFDEDDTMTEYEPLDESNSSLTERVPVYVGGYIFDEVQCKYLRHGNGYLIDAKTGMACAEGVWEKGEFVSDTDIPITNGWYVENQLPLSSLRFYLNYKNLDALSAEEGGHVSSPVKQSPQSTSHPLPSVSTLPINSTDQHVLELAPVEIPTAYTIQPPADLSNRPTYTQPIIPDQVGQNIPYHEQQPMPLQPPENPEPDPYKSSDLQLPEEQYQYQYQYHPGEEQIQPESYDPSMPTQNDDSVFHVNCTNDLGTISSTIQTIILHDNTCNDTAIPRLELHVLQYLKEMIVGDNVLMQADMLILDNMPYLSCLHVGKNSFTLSPDTPKECQGRALKVQNCPLLEEVIIDAGSFSDYSACTFSGLENLQRLVIGSGEENSFNFYNANLELFSR